MGIHSEVALLVTVGLVVLAGCTGFGTTTQDSPPPDVELEELYLTNEDSEPHTIDLVVQRNETVVHWNTTRLNGTYTDGATKVAPGRMIPVSGLPGQYVLFIRVDNRTTKRVDLNERVGYCDRLSIKIQLTDGGDVALFHEAGCE